MNVSCPQCSTVYRVDPAKVPEGGVRARCSACGGVIAVGMSAGASQRESSADAMAAAFSERRPQPGPFMPGSQRTTPATQPRQATPPAQPRVTPPAQPRVTPSMQPRVPTPPQPMGAHLPPVSPTPRAASTAFRTPIAQPRVASPVAPQAPISVPPVTPPSQLQPPAPPAPASPASAASVPTTPVAASPAASGGSAAPQQATGGRRPINPFLARDPSLRAKRLARALVSDMVAYYPAKHAEGLEKGTLKELFRDEIKKSYEEYVAQVGADFARSTTHFQESLNEVLGAGRKIF
jgi:predicted Zn finger-like uncharacterized protein